MSIARRSATGALIAAASIAAVPSFGGSIAAAASPPPDHRAIRTQVIARLVRRPTAPRCRDGRLTWVTVRYRVVRQPAGKPRFSVGQSLLVVLACPTRPRGFSPRARGDAWKMSTGTLHRLTLVALRSRPRDLVDPFIASAGPRWSAVRIDQVPAERPPRVVVKVKGGAGLEHGLEFEQRAVVVGSDPGCDVLLDDDAVDEHHVRIVVSRGRARIMPAGEAPVAIAGEALGRGGRTVTYKDRIDIGPYQLHVVVREDGR